jgi:hypothetical protein
MSKRITSGVIAGIAAICVAVPAAGFADQGGRPHSKKACKVHRHYGHHKGALKGHHRGSDRGKKCGFQHTGQTDTTSSTGPSGQTGPTNETGMSGTHRHSFGHRH